MSDRRDFIKKSVLLGLAGLAGSMPDSNKLSATEKMVSGLSASSPAFSLPDLPYAYDALEPYIDRQTMEIHHGRHHKAYVEKLNGADLSSLNLALSDADNCKIISNSSPAIIRNNLGGHFNHSLFWQLLKANPTGAVNTPVGALANEINLTFKTFEDFKKEFSEKALKLFGSGWCWLVKDEQGKLKICTTPNQDNPLMQIAADKGVPLLALDVWEHAYYLKYQNKRADYIANWWSIINWQKADSLFGKK